MHFIWFWICWAFSILMRQHMLQLCKVERCSLKWCKGGKKCLNNRFCCRHLHARIWHLVKSWKDGRFFFFIWGCERWETLYKRLHVVLAKFVLVKRRLNHKTVMENKVDLDVRYSVGKWIQSKYSAFSGTQLFQGFVGRCLAVGLAFALYTKTLQLPSSPQSGCNVSMILS